jgi:thiol:disulfide interchange protein
MSSALSALQSKRALLQWLIAPDYYLYRHAFAVKARTSSQAIEIALAIPDGLAKTDEFFGDVEVYYGALDASVELAESVELIELSVTYQGCADAGLCYPPETKTFLWHTASGEVQKGKLSPTVLATNAPQDGGEAEDFGLIAALVFALLGGVILNIMPCVFPILSLKALSFTRGDAQSHRRSSLVYSAGVIVSFVGIAAVLIAIQQTGKLIGWGFQLQNTGFVIGLAYLFTLMGLSLNGLLHFGTSMMNVGQSLTEKDGDAGSFFTGILACGRSKSLHRTVYGKCAWVRLNTAHLHHAAGVCLARSGHGASHGDSELQRCGGENSAQTWTVDGYGKECISVPPVSHIGVAFVGCWQSKWCQYHGHGSLGSRTPCHGSLPLR